MKTLRLNGWAKCNDLTQVKGFITSLAALLLINFYSIELARAEFVALPKEGFAASAYTLCNGSGDFGLDHALGPSTEKNDSCAVTSAALLRTPMNTPIEGYTMVGMIARDVPMPAPYAGADNNVATLTDTFWRNADKTSCIYGTHVLMKPAPLADGISWEVNDISRGGFAGMPVEAAYFYKPPASESTADREVVFRIGRTFTSVRHAKGDHNLPALSTLSAAEKAITATQAAAVNDNWVTFTTDLNTNDPDGSTRPLSAMMYIKTSCSAESPEPKDGAIRLRTTGQNGQPALEISLPGLVPAGASVEVPNTEIKNAGLN